MKTKRLISLICSVVLLFTVIQLPAVASDTVNLTEREFAYLTNDEFSEVTETDNSGFDGWVLMGSSNDASAITEPVSQGADNYALKYSSTSNGGSFNSYVRKTFDDAIVFEEGKDVVIETKIKTSGTDRDTRSILKYNLVRDGAWHEYNYEWGSFITIETSKIYVPDRWNTYLTGKNVVEEATADKWYGIKITIHGTSKSVSYVVTDLNSGTVYNTETVINHPQEASWIENAINSLDFTIKMAPKTVYVDYIRVYQEKDVVMTTDARYAFDENITVNFSSPYDKYDKIVGLFDAQGNEVATENSISDDFKTVTLNPVEDMVPGATYKVMLNSELSPLNYTFVNNEATFAVLTVKPPKAENIEITGRVVIGSEIYADYDYICEAQEGNSVYEWYMAETINGDWTKLDGENLKELEITSSTYGKYIKFKVLPYAELEDGEQLDGVGGESNIIAPERVPVAENIALSAQIPYIDSNLSVTYGYFDENDDAESGTQITWYESEELSGPWTPIGTGVSCYIGQEQENKYIKCIVIPKNNAEFLNEGSAVEIVSTGVVTDIISATNKFVNGGLENGELSPWMKKDNPGVSANYKGITLVTEEEGVYSGNYALRSHPRIGTNTHDVYMQYVTLEKNKMYIASAMVKSATDSSYINVEPYVHLTGDHYARPYRDAEYTSVGTDWTRASLSFMTSTEAEFPIGWLSFSSPDADLYVDDMYVGELLISDIKTKEIEPVTIPKNGENEIKLDVLTSKNGVILNQFGESDGLTEQKAVVSVPETKGVKVVDNVICIDENAAAGTVVVTVKCIPDFDYSNKKFGDHNGINAIPAQSEFVKTLELELVAHDDKTPLAKNVKATGIVKAGYTLTGYFEYYQVDNKESNSKVKWMYADSPNGPYYDIPGATSTSYVVEEAYVNKYIKFAVLPETVDGLVGIQAESEWLVKPTKPVANNVTVSGNFNIGGSITASYEFSDLNKDSQGTSTFKWYVSDYQEGPYAQIAGQTGKTLVLTENLTDKYIKAGVTPVSTADPKIGAEVLSPAYTGPVAPVAKNVTITHSSGTLTGQYTYFHQYGAQETKTKYSWTVDGKIVSTNATYVMNFSGTKSVTFTVTPVGDSNPSTGEPVSVTVTITGNSNNGGSAGGGASGGGSSGGASSGGGASSSIGSSTGVGITSINDMIPKEEANTLSSDIAGHWGEGYIKEMEKRNVMTSDEKGNFDPDKLVSREDMLTYLFKALQLETTNYSGMFNDVADGEFAQMLQTMVDNGTISVDTSFRPNDSISREEMCKILYISLENAGKLGDIEEGSINDFADKGDVSDWAVKYVNAIYSKKIMIGVSDDRFAPKENLTKAQAATLLVRILTLTEEAK